MGNVDQSRAFHHGGPVRFQTSSSDNCRGTVTSLVGRDSSVGIAKRYVLDGPGIESLWGARFSAPVQTCLGAHPPSCTMGTRSFPRVKRPGRLVDQRPHLLPRLKKEYICTSPPSRAFVTCCRVNLFNFKYYDYYYYYYCYYYIVF